MYIVIPKMCLALPGARIGSCTIDSQYLNDKKLDEQCLHDFFLRR